VNAGSSAHFLTATTAGHLVAWEAHKLDSIGRQTWPQLPSPGLAYCSPWGALGSKLTASRHLAQMANTDQVKALVRSHAKGDDSQFYLNRPSGG
jgi:hypothetical protein